MEGSEDRAYAVEVVPPPDGWSVRIVAPDETTVFTRACSTEREAEMFASTVRQHAEWLSPGRFRAYYRLPEPT